MPFLAAIPPAVVAGMAIGGAAIGAVGAGLTAYGQYKQAKYQEDLANYQADMEARKTKYAIAQQTIKMRRLLSSQRAAYGAAGVDLAGTPLLVMEQTMEEGDRDARMIAEQGYAEEARYRAEGELYGAAGTQALVGGIIKAGSGLLSDIGGMYMQPKSSTPGSSTAPSSDMFAPKTTQPSRAGVRGTGSWGGYS